MKEEKLKKMAILTKVVMLLITAAVSAQPIVPADVNLKATVLAGRSAAEILSNDLGWLDAYNVVWTSQSKNSSGSINALWRWRCWSECLGTRRRPLVLYQSGGLSR
jgi:hypothetical protein